jgi:hypothetical protein
VGSDTHNPTTDYSTLSWAAPKVTIAGETDSNGNPAATFDLGNTSGTWMVARDAAIVLKNISFTNIASSVGVASKHGRLETPNCVVDSSFSRFAWDVRSGGNLNVSGEITQDTDKANRAVNIQEGFARVDAAISQTGSSDARVVDIFDGGQRVEIISSARLVGLGSSTTDALIHAQSPRHIKCNDAHFEGADKVAALDGPVEFIAQDGLSNLTDVNIVLDRLNGAQVNLTGARPDIGSVPVTKATDATTVLDRIQDERGAIFYERNKEQLYAYTDAPEYRSIPLFTKRKNRATPSDLDVGEMAVDETNSRMLYKARGGAVHYWNTDGTL